MKSYENLFENVDAIMITSPYNLRYFTSFGGGEGVCILTNGNINLFVDARYTEVAKAECEGVCVIEFKKGENLFELIEKTLKENDVQTLGFEAGAVTVAEYERYKEELYDIEFKDVGDRLEKTRMIKTDEELSNIRIAESIGDKAFSEVLPYIKAGVSENDIAAEIEYKMRKFGGSKTSFETIAVSGVKSSMPHGRPSNKKIESGDFLTLDFGCVYNGYCSDMTRTVAVEKVTEEMKKVYDTVLRAQLAGLDAIKEGVCASDADAVARKIIDDSGYKGRFAHSLGHGVGIRIHELPNLSPKCDIILEENMVVSCEPGIYIPNLFGVRIEDTVAVKKTGCENFTHSPKELIICG